MAFSTGVAFFPVGQLEQVGTDSMPDPDHDGDDDRPGQTDMAMAWERLMAMIVRADASIGLAEVGDLMELTADHYPVPEGDLGTVDQMDGGECYALDLGGDIIYVPATDAVAAWQNTPQNDGNNDEPTGNLPYNAANWEQIMATISASSNA